MKNKDFKIENGVLTDYLGTDSNVVIPSEVLAIEYHAFLNCTGLEKIFIASTVTDIGKSAFDGCDNLTIYAPCGSFAETFAKENGIEYINKEI